MRAFVLQDWVTIRGNSGITTIVQNEAAYLALDPYQDAVFWFQVSEVTSGGGTITMNFETAPLKDETLFSAMKAVGVNGVPIMTPSINAVILSQNPPVPLSRWVRWHLTTTGTTAAWDVSFRVLVAGNQIWTPGMGGRGSGSNPLNGGGG